MHSFWRLSARIAWLAAIATTAACSRTPSPGELSDTRKELRNRCTALADQMVNGSAHIAEADLMAATERTPEFCKATAQVGDSALRFSTWLPTEGWNGKMAFIGGGGFDGVLMDEEFTLVFSESVLTEGYAIVATNGGYDAPGGVNPFAYFKAEFAADAEKRIDFMYRSEHRTLPFADALIADYYGQSATHRYFEGCSMGGHDALLLSQRYPDDFDGIVARAPAGNIVGLMRAFARIGGYIRRNDLEFDDDDKALLADAVLDQCDANDGIGDGIISRPQACAVDVTELECADANASQCLSAAQVELVELVTTPIVESDGSIVHPGYLFGGEDLDKGWGEYVYPKLMGHSIGMLFAEGFVRSFVTGDQDYDTWNWDPAEWSDELADIDRQFNAIDPDIGEFQEKGGKLILWTGTLDTSVSPLDTVRYYDSVVAELGKSEASDTVELFLAPGVAHCFGGVGPDKVDLMAALSTWVEQDTPPSTQELLHRKIDEDGETVMTRPLCAYPAYPRYRGDGDPADAGSFVCADAANPSTPDSSENLPDTNDKEESTS